MRSIALATMLAAGALSLTACSGGEGGGNEAATGQSGEAGELAGNKTIAAGIDQNSKFLQAAKATGLDSTLAGPGPYTVLIPDEAAFAKLPAGALENLLKPEQKLQLTSLLTYHILPGVILAEDIGKSIDNGKGKAVLATMGGGTLSAAREGDKIVLTDGSGAKSTVSQADVRYTNGVVHRLDTVLTPGATGDAPGTAPAATPAAPAN